MVESIEDLFIEEKQNEIIKYIDKVEKVTIKNLMDLLKVSSSTVRRYLVDLERKNLIIRTRGGALKKKYFKYEFSLNEKKDLNLSKKQKIARVARRFVNEGDILYISGGTTTFEFAKLLYDINDLVVFTNAFNILSELANHPNLNIKFLGGDFRRKTFSCVGHDTTSVMQKYNFNKAFIGANGVSIEEGVTTPNELEAKVDGEVIKRSKESFLLVDDTKFGAVAFSVIADLSDINYIVTNKELESDIKEAMNGKKVEILYK